MYVVNFVRRSLFLLKGFLSNVRITDVWFLGTWENGRGREVDMIFSRLWGFADLYAYLPRLFFLSLSSSRPLPRSVFAPSMLLSYREESCLKSEQPLFPIFGESNETGLASLVERPRLLVFLFYNLLFGLSSSQHQHIKPPYTNPKDANNQRKERRRRTHGRTA